jgi:hypothetical protein
MQQMLPLALLRLLPSLIPLQPLLRHPLPLPPVLPPSLLLPPLLPMSLPLPLPLPEALPLPLLQPPPRALLLLLPTPQPQPSSNLPPAAAAARGRTNQLTQLLQPLPRLRPRALSCSATFPHASPPVPSTAPE